MALIGKTDPNIKIEKFSSPKIGGGRRSKLGNLEDFPTDSSATFQNIAKDFFGDKLGTRDINNLIFK